MMHKILCYVGLHNWSCWLNFNLGKRTLKDGITINQREVAAQKHWCTVCLKVEVREIS